MTDSRLRKHIQASRSTSVYRLAEVPKMTVDGCVLQRKRLVCYYTGHFIMGKKKKKSSMKHINFLLSDRKEEHSVSLIPRFCNESVRTGGPAQVFRNRSVLF